MGMDSDFKGKDEIDGDEYHVEEEETEAERRPFKAILDVGIRRTCEGARIWGALKGAADGGLHVPHKTKNFPGYTAPEEKGAEAQYDAEAHKAKIEAKKAGKKVGEVAEKAGEEAGKLLPKNSATKHSLALNLAVFYHESCDDQAEAINVTTAALAELSSEELMHEDVTEVTEIKKLLEENLKLWTDPNKMLQYDGTAVEDC